MAIVEGVFERLWALGPAREADWDAVYAEMLPPVYNFFRYRVGDGPVAEDLASLTFHKAWAARGRFTRDRGAFAAWLFTIARHVAIDHYRSRRVHLPLEEAGAVAGTDRTEAAAEQRSDLERLSRLLAELPERERELIALKYGAERTNRDIARITGLSESNVGTLLHRCVKTLRGRWDPGGHDE